MTKEQIEKMRELDDAAEQAGGYVAPLPGPSQHYNYRKMLEYCKEKKMDPLDLTLRELHQFLIE